VPCRQLGWKRLLTEKMRTILEMWADDMRLSLRGHAWHAGQPKIPFWRLSSCFQRCRVPERRGRGQAGFAKLTSLASLNFTSLLQVRSCFSPSLPLHHRQITPATSFQFLSMAPIKPRIEMRTSDQRDPLAQIIVMLPMLCHVAKHLLLYE
jgi:hypothetical protein